MHVVLVLALDTLGLVLYHTLWGAEMDRVQVQKSTFLYSSSLFYKTVLFKCLIRFSGGHFLTLNLGCQKIRLVHTLSLP